jgi:hypothetical protein
MPSHTHTLLPDTCRHKYPVVPLAHLLTKRTQLRSLLSVLLQPV